MKKMWKNVLGIVLVAAISAGAAVGTSAYLINKNQPVFGTSGSANTFNQPIRLAGYNTVAAENTDFTTAAESTVHGVVHIKATTNAKQYATEQSAAVCRSIRVFLRIRRTWRVPTPANRNHGSGPVPG